MRTGVPIVRKKRRDAVTLLSQGRGLVEAALRALRDVVIPPNVVEPLASIASAIGLH